ncbi:hypothetical protein ACODT3_43150 [Streptomyces sp. 4.24]|uniref:hypothetical protein n=1 Tax=Streptomyces tritrimontium TaxID=3406573 RepID=UPI003BB4EFD6
MNREHTLTVLPAIAVLALLTTACGPDAEAADAADQAKRAEATALVAGIWSNMTADAHQGACAAWKEDPEGTVKRLVNIDPANPPGDETADRSDAWRVQLIVKC